jgi:hypothetical protein
MTHIRRSTWLLEKQQWRHTKMRMKMTLSNPTTAWISSSERRQVAQSHGSSGIGPARGVDLDVRRAVA